MSRLPVPFPLENEDRHDGKSVAGLKERVFRNQQSLGVLQERVGVLDGRAEIAGGSFAVLDGKGVVASMPFQALVAYSERVTIGGRDDLAGLRGTALRRREIKPSTP